MVNKPLRPYFSSPTGVRQLWLLLSRGQLNSSSLYGERPVLPLGTCLVYAQLGCALGQKPSFWPQKSWLVEWMCRPDLKRVFVGFLGVGAVMTLTGKHTTVGLWV